MKAENLVIGLVWLFANWVYAQEPTASESLEMAVARVFVGYCLECHSGAKPTGDLDLTRPDFAVRGLDLKGDPSASIVWQKIIAGEMPPESDLATEDHQILERWIKAGAQWDLGSIDPLELTTSNRAGRDWWSLQPIVQPDLPKVTGTQTAYGPIDAYVQAELERHQLFFSPPASPRILVRRVYFDLIGLPPPPDVVRAFEQDPSDAAYAAIVDQLLGSPEYGERWARHWLDVVRFGESDGFERNAPRDQMWHYRDWVIKALNADMPFDEFARRQIVGDLLTDDSVEGMAATGYLVAGVHNTVVGSSRTMQLLARQDELEDLVGNLGQTFLGLTFNCARCHDHKFDPITQQEYYQLIAALNGVNHGVKQVRLPEFQRKIDEQIAKRKKLQDELWQLDSSVRNEIVRQRNPDDRKYSSPVQPVLRWSFGQGLTDNLHSLAATLQGDARIEMDGLAVDGDGDFAVTDPLPMSLREKTLEVWIVLNDLTQQGGAAISVESNDGTVFDAIVFAEREPKMWMAGSNGFVRTQSLGGDPEIAAAGEVLHLAISYSANGDIVCYRNGAPYGSAYKTAETISFTAGTSRILFGLRHSPAGGNKFLNAMILRAQVYDRVLTPEEIAESASSVNAYVSESELIAHMGLASLERRKQLSTELQKISEQLRILELAAQVSIYTNIPSQPGPTYFLSRGDVTKPGDEVLPGTTRAIANLAADFGLPSSATDGQRRLQLARWVTDKANPLFRRVIVNRLWQSHFGRGLVSTPSDFGFNGGPPSHPQLLDWLSNELERQGYRLKPLHRLMVLSTAYRQSSGFKPEAWKMDAENRLLWRKTPMRLEAEVIRDSMLAVAGILNAEHGGPSFKDVEIIDQNNGTTYYSEIDRDAPQFNRRTIYRFSPRGGRSALLDTLDCPDPSAAAPRRSVTTTPLQALSLLNSPFVLRMSDAIAERVTVRFPHNVKMQVEWMFQLAFCRSPDEDELKGAQALVEKHGAAALARALLNSGEFVTAQ